MVRTTPNRPQPAVHSAVQTAVRYVHSMDRHMAGRTGTRHPRRPRPGGRLRRGWRWRGGRRAGQSAGLCLWRGGRSGSKHGEKSTSEPGGRNHQGKGGGIITGEWIIKASRQGSLPMRWQGGDWGKHWGGRVVQHWESEERTWEACRCSPSCVDEVVHRGWKKCERG